MLIPSTWRVLSVAAVAIPILASAEEPPPALVFRGHKDWVSSIAFSPDGKRMVSGSDDETAKIWEVATGHEIHTLRGSKEAVTAVAFGPGGDRVATGSWAGDITIWNSATGKKLLTLEGHEENITALEFSPDGDRLVSGSGDDTLRIWDLEDGEELHEMSHDDDYDVADIAFSPDGERVVSGDADKLLKLWDAEFGDELLAVRPHDNAISAVAFTPDGKRLATASWDKTIKVLDMDGESLMTLVGHDEAITSMAIRADGKRIASGGWDKTLRIWDAATGKALRVIKAHEENITSVAFSPDGEKVASASKGEVKMWEIGDGGSNEKAPNILVIVADDLGWADVGYHGSPIPTPNIDRLCRAGVELDRHYVAPMCTPTRVSLLTGRYPSRFGNTTPSNEQVLPFGTVTLAVALREAGYETAITGKWHLGSLPKWGPKQFGFDRSHGSLAGGVNPWNHLYKQGPYSKTWHRDDVLIEEEGHATDLITAEAVRFIEEVRDGPFFLYVPYTAVHTPFDEPPGWLERCKHIPEGRRQYAACTAHLDDGVGLMIRALRDTGQFDDTIILFFSDNGGTNGDDSARYPDTKPKGKVAGLNTPLRGWKTQVYEGGIRVPAFVHWPAKLKPRKVTTPLHVTDWMPTLTRIVGWEPRGDLKWDGVDVWPILTGELEAPEERQLYTPGVRHRSAALHLGNWKLVRNGTPEKARFELFDLATDPNETKDLAATHPERLAELKALLAKEIARDNDALPGSGPTKP